MVRNVRKRRGQEHLELALKITNWGKANGLLSHPYISGVINSLMERRTWPLLATYNHFDLIPHPPVHVKNRKIRATFYLTLVRNIFVFVPVALTWSAVSHATAAFAIYVKQNGNSLVNFLEFWQNGFGILAHEWVIGFIAFLDFVLISVVILLTILVSLLERSIDQDEIIIHENLEAERISLCMEISEFFWNKRTLTPVVAQQSLAQSLNQMVRASEALNKSSKALEITTKEVTKQNLKLFLTKQRSLNK